MKNATVIVAVDKRPKAPIFGVADYGLEADQLTAAREPLSRLRPAASRLAARPHPAVSAWKSG